jgi:hypothetical protein
LDFGAHPLPFELSDLGSATKAFGGSPFAIRDPAFFRPWHVKRAQD